MVLVASASMPSTLRSQAAHAERKAEEQAGDQAGAFRHQLLRIGRRSLEKAEDRTRPMMTVSTVVPKKLA